MKNGGDSRPVLLVRINCLAEIANTSDDIDLIRNSFPDSPLVAISSPHAEAREAVAADRRIESVRDVTVAGSNFLSRVKNTVRLLGLFGATRATVICFGATDGLNYYRHVITGLLFGGEKYVIGPDHRLTKVLSSSGLKSVTRSLLQWVSDAISVRTLLQLYPEKKSTVPAEALFPESANVLAVKLDSLGDVVASLPLLQAISISTGQPLDILVRAHIAPLLTNVTFIRKIHTYDHVHIRGFESKTISLIRSLRSESYDRVIELTGNSPTARLFSRLSGCNIRIGVVEPNDSSIRTGGGFINRRLKSFESDDDYTKRAHFLAEQLDMASNIAPYYFETSPESTVKIDKTLSCHHVARPFAVLHMRPSTAYKSWRAESFANVSDYLSSHYGFEILLTGTKEDLEINEQMVQMAQNPSKVHNIAGEIPLLDLPALFDKASIVVAVDTGPAHIAGACRCPLVVLGLYSPFGKDFALIKPDDRYTTENAAHPLYSVSVHIVKDAIDNALSATP